MICCTAARRLCRCCCGPWSLKRVPQCRFASVGLGNSGIHHCPVNSIPREQSVSGATPCIRGAAPAAVLRLQTRTTQLLRHSGTGLVRWRFSMRKACLPDRTRSMIEIPGRCLLPSTQLSVNTAIRQRMPLLQISPAMPATATPLETAHDLAYQPQHRKQGAGQCSGISQCRSKTPTPVPNRHQDTFREA